MGFKEKYREMQIGIQISDKKADSRTGIIIGRSSLSLYLLFFINEFPRLTDCW